MKKILLSLLIAFTLHAKAQDYLKLESFKLDNGFTVYLLPDKNATTTYGAVAVNAGSKNDPADATGLAHYLEHLLFKGTTTMGTIDYEKEKPYLDSITIYYQQLGKTKDEAQRKKIKALINNQALQASKFGLPTEFHTLLSSIGGTDINAFTANDMTVYHNAFPGEQLEKWLDLYSERFINPVFRSFQSELEVVYEEKNRASDNFQFKLILELYKNLFPNHPYGTQTSIGTTEHLKNPPIDRIYEFFNSYYIANNMALFLVGNFDVQTAIPLIKEKFGKLKSGVIPSFPAYTPSTFSKNSISKLRVTPIKVDILGFKSTPENHPDELALEVCNKLLFNESETGFLNKLQQQGKCLGAFSMPLHLHDDGAEIFILIPKIVGQSFGSAEKLLLAQIDSIVNGNFSNEFLDRVKNELIKNFKLEMEDPESRGMNLISVFNVGKPWEEIISYPDQISKISKGDVMQIAKKYYQQPYYAIHSKTGFPKKDQMEKPGFKPVITEQTEKSVYAHKFESIPDAKIAPKFLDFKEEISSIDLGKNNKLLAYKNTYNDIANLTIKYYIGTEKIKNLDLAAQLLNESSPKGISLQAFKESLAKLNCNASFEAEDDFFNVSIKGEEINIAAALSLVGELIKNPQASPDAKKNLQDGIKASFEEEQKDPSTMGRILRSYALYGKQSPYVKRASMAEVKNFTDEHLLKLVQEACSYSASFHYCGNGDVKALADAIVRNYNLNEKGKAELSYTAPANFSKPTIYLVNDSKSRQNQVYFSVVGEPYQTADDAKIALLGNYLGGSFSGLILQEIREYRSLAYSAGGRFLKPEFENKPLLFSSFAGCQADKTNEAIDVMLHLFSDLPKYPDRLTPFKNYTKSTVTSEYPDQREHTESIEEMELRGFTKDPLINEFNTVDETNFEDIFTFYEKNIKSKPIVITIYGDKSKIDLEKLKKLGEIIELKKEEIATY